jgi:general secretion pathway protein C
MEMLLRKYLWVVDLVVVVLCAGLTARATATMVGSAMRSSGPSQMRITEAPASAPRGSALDKQIEDILRRNIFCSSCRPIISPVSSPSPSPLVSATGLANTTLPLRLLAIMYAPLPADLRWSVAIIRDDGRGTVGPYAIGSRLRGATVDGIDETRVYLSVGGGRREYLDLLVRATSEMKIEPRWPVTAPDPMTAELDAGISRTGEHRHQVQRSTVESLLGKMKAQAPTARIVPEVRASGPAGFRLLSVRADGPFARIGLLEGDVISAVDGLDLARPDNALAIYAKLRASDHISVAVERSGQNITEEYDLR